MFSPKPQTPLSRAERRRMQREGKDPTHPAPETDEKLLKRQQRKLNGSFHLLMMACAALAFVIGGKLWITVPLWLQGVGWMGIGGAALLGFLLWRKSRTSFKFQGRWLFRFALAFVFGVILGYFYVQAIRNIGELLQLSSLKSTHAQVLSSTSQWTGQRWTEAECKTFEQQQLQLSQAVVGQKIPPTGSAFRLLMAVNQTGYQAGCTVDFEGLATRLLDEDKVWRSAAPWQYNTIRQWINRSGWPRVNTGCQWEANRAKVAGNEPLYASISSMCHAESLQQLSPWMPDQYTQTASQIIEANRLSELAEQELPPSEE